MNNVKIVRMQNGQDIIGIVNEIIEGQYVIEQPMEFQLMHRGRVATITLAHYLPTELVAKNEVVLNSKDIVFITNPSKNFAEYYEGALMKEENSVNESLAKELSADLEERVKEIMMQAFGDLEDPGERTIH
jgi:hypothetical protein